MSNYSRWYTTGDVNVTNGSNVVTGTGTYWGSAGLKSGDMITLDGGDSFREIKSVNSDTSITLAANWNGATASRASYAIVRNFSSTTVSDVAAQVSDLLGDFQTYISTEMQTLKGKSAYEIAKENGYSGTEAEWIDFLRNGGGFTDLVSKTSNLETLDYRVRYNCGYRGISLGNTVTAAQKEALCRWAGGKGDSNIIIGDHWDFTMPDGSTTIAYVAGFYTHYFIGPKQGQGLTCVPQTTLLLKNSSWQFPMHKEDVTEESVGLAGTTLVSETLPALAQQIMPFFGDTLTSEYTLRVSSSFDRNTGQPTSWTNLTANLWLPGIENLYHMHYVMFPRHYAEACDILFPIERFNPTILWDAKEYWFANTNGWKFALMHRYRQLYNVPQNESHYIMPYMIIGPNWG